MLNPNICPACFQPNEPARKLCWKCMRSMEIPANQEDYLRVFELRNNWDLNDLKQAFRRLARKYHPDVNPGDREADAHFKFVNQAYEALCKVQEASAAAPEDSKIKKSIKPQTPEERFPELQDKLRRVIYEATMKANELPPKKGLAKLIDKINSWFKK